MPMNLNPSCTAARPVLPLPMNGSSTRPLGGVMSRQSQRISSVGFTVGWLFAELLSVPSAWKLPGFFVPELQSKGFFYMDSHPSFRSSRVALAQ